MKNKIKRILSLMVVVISLISCSSNDSQVNNDSSDIPSTGSYIRATVDNNVFSSKVGNQEQVFVLKSALSIQISGTSATPGRSMNINLVGINQTGVYTIDKNSNSYISYSESGIYYDSKSNCTGATGTITINTINNTTVEGSFSFTGKESGNCTASKVVTNGSFRAIY